MERKRTALVTGGAKGIGKAIALKLAECGFSLAVHYNTSKEQAYALVNELQNRGVNAIAVQADLTDYAQTQKMYEQVKAHFGFIDTLVNNAGVSLIKPLYECTTQDFDTVINANLRSV